MDERTADETFFYKRLYQLRIQKGVSAREMSLALGQSAGYINKIENEKSLPSMVCFFYICEYFGITPQEFFARDTGDPVHIREIVQDLRALDGERLSHIAAIVRDLKK